jgi:sodium-dependent phosphate transporter
LGPFLLQRGPVPPIPEGVNPKIVQDYYRGVATREDLVAAALSDKAIEDIDHLKAAKEAQGNTAKMDATLTAEAARPVNSSLEQQEVAEAGPWYNPSNLWRIIVNAVMHGVRKDIIALQKTDSKVSGKSNMILEMHARAAHFDNKTEQ